MDQKQKYELGLTIDFPPKSVPPAPEEAVNSHDVERVLEHVSSPYRWEVLDVPASRAKVTLPGKTVRQKSKVS